MGWWERQVVPRLVDLTCGNAAVDRLRAPACEGLHGDVLELGFGSGLNLAHYPAAVTRVLAVEPSDVAWDRSQERRDGSPVHVVRAGLDGERLDLPDASVDCALCTFTLCTVPDPVAALREVGRVLRPGGRLHFVEHGLSPDPGVARWQHRLTPVQRRLGGGCHLDRPVLDLMREAGLVVEDVATFYAARPRAAAYVYAGRAASTR